MLTTRGGRGVGLVESTGRVASGVHGVPCDDELTGGVETPCSWDAQVACRPDDVEVPGSPGPTVAGRAEHGHA